MRLLLCSDDLGSYAVGQSQSDGFGVITFKLGFVKTTPDEYPVMTLKFNLIGEGADEAAVCFDEDSISYTDAEGKELSFTLENGVVSSNDPPEEKPEEPGTGLPSYPFAHTRFQWIFG